MCEREREKRETETETEKETETETGARDRRVGEGRRRSERKDVLVCKVLGTLLRQQDETVVVSSHNLVYNKIKH